VDKHAFAELIAEDCRRRKSSTGVSRLPPVSFFQTMAIFIFETQK
jgi:hypothetical protein